MREGRTRRGELDVPEAPKHSAGWSATLVEVDGGAEGNEYPIDQQRLVLGRGPDADIAFAAKSSRRAWSPLDAAALARRASWFIASARSSGFARTSVCVSTALGSFFAHPVLTASAAHSRETGNKRRMLGWYQTQDGAKPGTERREQDADLAPSGTPR